MSDDKQTAWMSASQNPPKSGDRYWGWSDMVAVRYCRTEDGAEDVTIGLYNHKEERWYLYGVTGDITITGWAYMNGSQEITA